jgi:hypothetical protein
MQELPKWIRRRAVALDLWAVLDASVDGNIVGRIREYKVGCLSCQ